MTLIFNSFFSLSSYSLSTNGPLGNATAPSSTPTESPTQCSGASSTRSTRTSHPERPRCASPSTAFPLPKPSQSPTPSPPSLATYSRTPTPPSSMPTSTPKCREKSPAFSHTSPSSIPFPPTRTRSETSSVTSEAKAHPALIASPTKC